MRLFAARSTEAVTVAEIANEASMTSAAVYYHYASKDDILLEGLHAFGKALTAELRREQREIKRGDLALNDVPATLLVWMDDNRDAAIVYFTGSAGLTLPVESLRREVRGELITLLSQSTRQARPGLNVSEAAVISVALLSLLDSSAAAWLNDDQTLKALGRKDFLAETAQIASRILGD
jgi:AcrR family transcriptional regulator